MNYIRLLSKYPNYIGYGALHYFYSSLGQSFLISLFVLHFTEALQISNVAFGWFYSGATLVSALILPVLGVYLDKVKLRYISVAIGIGLSFFCILASQVYHPVMLFIALVGLRFFGQGMMPLTASTSVARYFDFNRGKALSIAGFGLPIGEFILPLLITTLILSFGWRMTWLILAASVVLFFIPASLKIVSANNPFQVNQEVKKRDKSAPKTHFIRKVVLRDPRFYLLSLVLMFVPFFMTGLLIHQNMIADIKGWSQTLMASAIMAFGITRLATNLIAGPAIDRFSALQVYPFVLVPLILGSLAAVLTNHPLAAFVLFMLSGATNSILSLTATAMWAEIYGTANLGAIRSMVTTLVVFSAAIAPVIMGWGFETPSRFYSSLWIYIGLMILASLTAIWGIRLKAPEKELQEDHV